MAILISWLVFSLLVASYGGSKGHSAGKLFLLSILLSPLIGLLAAVLMKPNQAVLDARALSDGSMQKCPACAELVRVDAVKCRYCGTTLRPKPASAAVTAPPPKTPQEIRRNRVALLQLAVITGGLLALAVWLNNRQASPATPEDVIVITLTKSKAGVTATNDGNRDRIGCSARLEDGRHYSLPPLKPHIATPVSFVQEQQPQIVCGGSTARIYWVVR